jgi:hypothetical protein
VALSDPVLRLSAQGEEEREEPMSVIAKNAVPVAGVTHAGGMEKSNGKARTRSAEEYRELWQQMYEDALAGGASRDGARYVANERLVRIQAEDAQVDPPGVGNYLNY